MAATFARSQRTGQGGPPSSGRQLLKVGDLLAGKYRVERILGEGGMGVVVAAYHELLDQHVAVKLLYQDVADREAQSRLLLEARSAAKLQSEHVARVVDVDTDDAGLPFIVMELLDGADLCQIADERGALPRWLVVDYMLQALEGLAHAHARGIIHRDLKPSNLFLTNKADGTQIIKILDFGISKSQEQAPDKRTAQLTGGRAVLGSPPYMSPEQVRSPKTVDHRTDIWSLGICMYELLTNSMPFGGDQIQETFAQILENQPTPIRTMVSGVPEGLEQIVMRCIAKNREERWSDVGELAKALVPYGSGSWIHSADRIMGTLSRPFLDDATSGMRLSLGKQSGRLGPATPQAISIPMSPGKRNDSLQPELTGTASTVARRFTMFSPQKKIIFYGAAAATAIAGLVGVGLIVLTISRAHSRDASASTTTPPPEATESATPVDNPAGAATSIVTTPPSTASPENELPNTAPTGTLLGASPLPTTTSSPTPPAKTGARPVAVSPVPTPAPNPYGRPAPVTTAKKPVGTGPAGTSRPALPPGLPLTRQ